MPRLIPPALLLASLSLTGCALDEPDTGETTSALTDQLSLPTVPGTPTPAGFGTYCSVTDPTNGGWALLLRGPGGDPCGELAPNVGGRALIRRAGLWNTNGNNNAMARCDNGVLSVRRELGAGAESDVFADAQRV